MAGAASTPADQQDEQRARREREHERDQADRQQQQPGRLGMRGAAGACGRAICAAQDVASIDPLTAPSSARFAVSSSSRRVRRHDGEEDAATAHTAAPVRLTRSEQRRGSPPGRSGGLDRARRPATDPRPGSGIAQQRRWRADDAESARQTANGSTRRRGRPLGQHPGDHGPGARCPPAWASAANSAARSSCGAGSSSTSAAAGRAADHPDGQALHRAGREQPRAGSARAANEHQPERSPWRSPPPSPAAGRAGPRAGRTPAATGARTSA